MSIIIHCFLQVRSSGERSSIGTSGANRCMITEEVSLDDKILFGIKILKGTIKPHNVTLKGGNSFTEKIQCDLEIENDIEEDARIAFMKNFVRFLTFFISQYEENPQNGFTYFEVDWLTYHSYKPNEGRYAPYHTTMKMTMTSVITWDAIQWDATVIDEYIDVIFNNYYNGIKTNDFKSKYFHWFLILEAIEKSDAYKRAFVARLFDKIELEDIAKKFKTGDAKYNAIMNLKDRLMLPRKERLYKMLLKMGVQTYRSFEEDVTLSVDTVEKIIRYRNELFHEGGANDEWFVWRHLFPIVRTVIELLMKNPNLLK